MQCTQCEAELKEGVNCFSIQQGIEGVEDFVPLGERLQFCNSDCTKKYLARDGESVIKLHRGIP